MSSSLTTFIAAAEESTHELPMSPLAFGIIAMVVFMALLGVLWSFRGTAAKIATGDEHLHAHADGSHAPGHGQGGHH